MAVLEIQFFWDESLTLFSSRNLQVLIAGMLVGFLVAVVQHIIAFFPLAALLSPLASRPADVFPTAYKKLEAIPNKYTLHQHQSLIPSSHAAASYNQAASYVIVDYDTGDVLEDQRADTSFPVASLTKIMTAVVALDLATPGQELTISERAAAQVPTKIGVIAGQQMTLDELLHALLMTSANDAAQAIQDGLDTAYGSTVFIRAMNAKATLLGLSHSSFDNAQGYDSPANFSSGHDLAILSHYALENYPLIASIVKEDHIVLPETSTHKQFDLYNWNGLLGVYPDVVGMKIGNTAQAGKTTIVVAQREGKKILVVLLGAQSVIQRDLWAAQLLDEGFSLRSGLPSINITEEELKQKYSEWRYWG